MHVHTLAAHASSGTDPQCCTVVNQRCVIEREVGWGGEVEKARDRERKRAFTLPLTNWREAPVWRSCMKRVVPTEDFLIRPWKPRSGGRRTRREEEKSPCWLNRRPEFHLRDYWTFYIWAPVMVISHLIVSCWQEPLCFLDFLGIKVCFQSRVCEWSVWKQETCQTDVSVTCWRESGCCGCGKVSSATFCSMAVCLPLV